MMDTLAKHLSANATTVYNLSLTNEEARARLLLLVGVLIYDGHTSQAPISKCDYSVQSQSDQWAGRC